MKRYSIRAVSEQLNISKHALRYYDKIHLLCPTRGENNYRYYTEQDVLDLQYVEVMKFAGFSLAEIKKVISNKRTADQSGLADTTILLADKKQELERKIDLYCRIVKLITEAEQVLRQKADSADVLIVNEMITRLFKELEIR